MRVKSKEIAEILGVSPSTVSLALNNKPGVKPETRKMIIDYIENIYKKQYDDIEKETRESGMIRVVVYIKSGFIILDPNNQSIQMVLSGIERTCRNQGLEVKIIYFDIREDDINDFLQSCNKDNTCGMILFANEMNHEDFKPFKELKFPLVVYDNDFTMYSYDSVVSDNLLAMDMGIRHLKDYGIREVMYFKTSVDYYNLEQRRRGFKYSTSELLEGNAVCKEVEVGKEIDEIYRNVIKYLEENRLPQAIFCENYSVSVGTVTACKDMGIRIPEDVSILGVDEIPRYLMTDLKLTCLNILFPNRGLIAMKRLIELIQGNNKETALKISFTPILIRGDSVNKESYK